MPRCIDAESILDDIEFELVQGTLGSDSLSDAIEGVERFQNTRRAQLLASKDPAALPPEGLHTLFQIDDMVLGLLREMAAELQSLRLELRRAYALSSRQGGRQTNPISRSPGSRDAAYLPGEAPPSFDVTVLPDRPDRKEDELREAMQADALEMQPQIGHSTLPVVGRLLVRLRVFLHSHGILYARLLAGKQTPINRIYGDWLLYLNEMNREQQEEIAALRTELAALRAGPTVDGPGQ